MALQRPLNAAADPLQLSISLEQHPLAFRRALYHRVTPGPPTT
jgi:hypothetical protein